VALSLQIYLEKYKCCGLSCVLLGVLSALLLLSACTADRGTGNFTFSQSAAAGQKYKAALKSWTREARIYDFFDNKLIAQVTYKSIAFRTAYGEEYARVFKLTEAEKTRFLKDQRDAAKMYEDFVMAAYVPDKKLNDFDKKKPSWNVYLHSATGKRSAPLEVRKLKKNDPLNKHFYPFASPWNILYMIRFSGNSLTGSNSNSDKGGGYMRIEITGLAGSTQLNWAYGNNK